MRLFLVTFVFAFSVFAQIEGSKTVLLEDSSIEKNAEQMFLEVLNYPKNESKRLRGAGNASEILGRQKKLAFEYAQKISSKEELSLTDSYYAATLFLIAGDDEKAKKLFEQFLQSSGKDELKRQDAFANLAIIFAKQKNCVKADGFFAEYQYTSMRNESEEALQTKASLHSLIATCYFKTKDYEQAIPHGERAYEILRENRFAVNFSELAQLESLLFEIYRLRGENLKAEQMLENLRRTAVSSGSASVYYKAVDEKIKYLIENGRKKEALDFYNYVLGSIDKDLRNEAVRNYVKSRLKRKQRHYEILGEDAFEILNVDKWFLSEIKLSKVRGKVILIDFWATWCGTCVSMFPKLKGWRDSYKDKGFEIIGLTRYYGEVEGSRADKETELEFIGKFKEKFMLDYPIAIAIDAINHHNYGVQGLPTTVIIDRLGKIRYIEAGVSAEELERIQDTIESLLNERD